MILFSRRPPLSDQPLPMPSYSLSSIRGKALEKEFLDLLHKGAIEQAPQTPGFYSRLFVVQKDSGVLATHHRPVYPEHIHSVTTLPYGDSSVRPTLHSPRRLDDLIGSSGRLPSSSNPLGITSVSSLHYRRSPIPVQGTMLRANNCPSGLYKAHGSNIRHSPSLRYQDPPISRRLVDSSRIQDHLYSIMGEQQVSGVWTPSQKQMSINLREIWQCRTASWSSASSSEARRPPCFATMSQQSRISGDREARGPRSCSSKQGRSSCGSNLCRSRSYPSSSRVLSTQERISSVDPTW